jgi:NAD(P)-dependent dehydrogenase (short-subunit alcohol dehydrogenase family)
VTGAAMGLGQASAIALAEEGARLILFDRDAEGLEATAAAAGLAGGPVHTRVLDLTDETEIVQAFADARERCGPCDILLNNVGGSARERAREFWESSSEVWRDVIGLSLMPTLYCSRQVVPDMRARKAGKIVNIASDAPLVGDSRHCDYSAAKAGVIGFTRSLARELAPFAVNVNAICPGPMHTRAVDLLPREMMERVASTIPMQRYGRPEEVARAVVFLASGDSDYITGQSLLVDGGRWMV